MQFSAKIVMIWSTA